MAKRKIQWDESRDVAASVRRELPRIVADYFDEVRDFLRKDREPEELHRMRLASKRLRYTLELFRPCYGPKFEERLEVLKELQDALGDVNDAVVARKLLGKSVDGDARKFLGE